MQTPSHRFQISDRQKDLSVMGSKYPPPKSLGHNYVEVAYHPLEDMEPRSILSHSIIETHMKLARRQISEAFLTQSVPPFMEAHTQYAALVNMRRELLELGSYLWNTNDAHGVINRVCDEYLNNASCWTTLMAPAFFIYAEVDKKIGIELIIRAKAIQAATDALAYMPVAARIC